MKKQFILGMVAITALQVAGPAFAQNRGGAPLPPPPPSSVRERHQEGSVELQKITRASQGQWYRVSLRNRVRLDRVEIAVLSQRLKIHEANVITASGSRIDIRELNNTPVLSSGARIISENLNIREDILTIDIRAESHGGFADARVSAYSSDERPQLVVGDVAPSRPSQPSRPDRPSHPGRPDNNRPDRYCQNTQDIVYELDRLGGDLETWIQRTNSSVYGSTQYNMSSREAQAVADRMVALANNNRVKNISLATLEEMAQKALKAQNKATYGTLGYNTQASVATALFTALAGALDVAITCEINTAQELIQIAESYIKKASASTYGTLAYNSYSNVGTKAFSLVPKFYEQEVSRRRLTFVDMDKDAEQFYSKMSSYTYGTLGYNSFSAISQKAAEMAEVSLRNSLSYLGANERFELVRAYETKRNRFTYGTLMYNHFDSMVSILANGR